MYSLKIYFIVAVILSRMIHKRNLTNLYQVERSINTNLSMFDTSLNHLSYERDLMLMLVMTIRTRNQRLVENILCLIYLS